MLAKSNGLEEYSLRCFSERRPVQALTPKKRYHKTPNPLTIKLLHYLDALEGQQPET